MALGSWTREVHGRIRGAITRHSSSGGIQTAEHRLADALPTVASGSELRGYCD